MAGPFLPGGRDALPGITARVDQVANNFLKNADHRMTRGITIDKDVVDSGNTPTTKLRAGLALVRVESGANKNKYVQVGHADDPGVGSRLYAVLLMKPVNMVGRDGSTTEDKSGEGLFHGAVDEEKVIFGTANPPDIDDIKGILDQVEFELKA